MRQAAILAVSARLTVESVQLDLAMQEIVFRRLGRSEIRGNGVWGWLVAGIASALVSQVYGKDALDLGLSGHPEVRIEGPVISVDLRPWIASKLSGYPTLRIVSWVALRFVRVKALRCKPQVIEVVLGLGRNVLPTGTGTRWGRNPFTILRGGVSGRILEAHRDD